MDQTGRIQEMEERLNRAAEALARLDSALEDLEGLRQDLAALADYYEGPLWREDLAADEAGELPSSLRRGVLSEDGLYDLLLEADLAAEGVGKRFRG